MRLFGLRTLRHSILAQMTLMSLLFLGGFTYLMIAKPIIDGVVEQRQISAKFEASIEDTVSVFIRTLHSRLLDNANLDHFTAIVADDYLQEVIDKNSNLEVNIRHNGKAFGTKGSGPRVTTFFDAEHYSIQSRFKETGICRTFNFRTSNEPTPNTVYFYGNYCDDRITAIEITGLEVPVTRVFTPQDYLPEWLWDSSKEVIYAVAGMFVLMMFILVFNLFTIKRVAKVARSIHPDSLTTTLPEQGLPIEVKPLIKAVNQMIDQVRTTTEKHDFFLSTAAHEMRTPLAVLRFRLDLLEDSPTKSALETDIKRIIDMVNQLLHLMKTREPKELTEYIDLVECCQTVTNDMLHLYNKHQVQLVFHSEVADFYRLADKHLFRVAITNLLDNALSFSRAGGTVTLTIDNQYKITIRDQGKGIDPERIDTIFNAFAKFPPNREDHHGLGLAIVQAIIVMHKGHIQVANRKTGGAKFEIAFND